MATGGLIPANEPASTNTDGHGRRDLLRRAALLTAGAGALFVAREAVSSEPAAAAVQGNWRYCRNCKGLFHAASGSTKCPIFQSGGWQDHDGTGSFQYLLNYALNPVPANYQPGWRWCHICKAMWYSYFGDRRCYSPDGFEKGHSQTGSGHYSIATSGLTGNYQTGWRWCDKCNSLFYGPNVATSWCFAGWRHNVGISANYRMNFTID